MDQHDLCIVVVAERGEARLGSTGPALEMCEGSLSTLVATLDRQPNVGLAGVHRVRSDGSAVPALRRYPLAADLCMRLQRRGWEVVHVPSATVRSLLPRYSNGRRKSARAALTAVLTGRAPASFAAGQPGLAGVSSRFPSTPTLRP